METKTLSIEKTIKFPNVSNFFMSIAQKTNELVMFEKKNFFSKNLFNPASVIVIKFR